jgi:hypothetical protein
MYSFILNVLLQHHISYVFTTLSSFSPKVRVSDPQTATHQIQIWFLFLINTSTTQNIKVSMIGVAEKSFLKFSSWSNMGLCRRFGETHYYTAQRNSSDDNRFLRINFIHSFHWQCRMRRFLVVLRSFFHSSLFYTLSFHPFSPTSLLPSPTSSCHLFLGLPNNHVVHTQCFLGFLFSSKLCTYPNQRKVSKLIVSVIGCFLTIAYISLLVNVLQFYFSYTGLKILLYTFL